MFRGFSIKLVLALSAVLCPWSFLDFAVAMEGRSQKSQILNQKKPCKSLEDPELINMCTLLQMDMLAPMLDPKKHALGNFLQTAKIALVTMTTEKSFQKLSRNPETFAQQLGFDSVAQLTKAYCGPALLVKMVGLQDLRNITESGKMPDKLLDAGYRIMVPLDVKDPTTKIESSRSSLTFSLRINKGEWRWTRRGSPKLIGRIHDHRNGQSLLVEIRGLNLRFLVAGPGKDMKLTPLYDNEDLGLEAGEPQQASTVITSLEKILKDIEANPTKAKEGRFPSQ